MVSATYKMDGSHKLIDYTSPTSEDERKYINDLFKEYHVVITKIVECSYFRSSELVLLSGQRDYNIDYLWAVFMDPIDELSYKFYITTNDLRDPISDPDNNTIFCSKEDYDKGYITMSSLCEDLSNVVIRSIRHDNKILNNFEEFLEYYLDLSIQSTRILSSHYNKILFLVELSWDDINRVVGKLEDYSIEILRMFSGMILNWNIVFTDHMYTSNFSDTYLSSTVNPDILGRKALIYANNAYSTTRIYAINSEY